MYNIYSHTLQYTKRAILSYISMIIFIKFFFSTVDTFYNESLEFLNPNLKTAGLNF